MLHRILVTGLSIACAASATLGAQKPASISGVVLSIDTPPQPVRRAIVSVSGGDIPSNISAIADDQGRFVFPDLRPGRYTVRASKAGHLTAAYGAMRPGAPGTAVALAAGQAIDLRLVLPRGAVITGTVRDHLGSPASGVQVTIAPASEISGSGGYRSSSDSILTDDRGVYRAYSLNPGEYVVSAIGRVISGGEIYIMTSADLDARLRRLQQQAGASGGSTAPAAATSMRPQALPPITAGQAYSYAPTFHPGTSIAADAARIRVAAGEVREGVDIPLAPVRAARVSGTIASGEVDLTRVRPTLTQHGPPQPSLQMPRLEGPAADGSFVFTSVTPGRYLLMARTGMGASMALVAGNGTTTNNPGIPALFAMQELSIDGSDVTGLTLSLRPALSLSGRIEFDAAALTPPETLTSLRVTLTTPGRAPSTVVNGLGLGPGPPPGGAVTADGTFTIAGIVPGTYGVTSAVPASGSARWWLRSAIVNGRDVLDHALEIDGSSSDMSGAVLTFTDRRNELTGTLSTADAAPASEYIVVVYPANETLWRPGGRRLRSVRPSSDGAFSVTELPAGEYLIAALTDITPDEWQHADFLRQLVPASVKISIADGQKVNQDLRIAR